MDFDWPRAGARRVLFCRMTILPSCIEMPLIGFLVMLRLYEINLKNSHIFSTKKNSVFAFEVDIW